MFTFSNSTKILIIFITTFCSCLAGSTRVMAEDTTWADHGALKVSSNGRYLVHSDGTPFLWMGDTAWGLSERLNRADVDYYLDARKAQGFNVIQLCLFWGKRKGSTNTFYVNPPNDYGHRALKNLTPAGSASANVVAGGDMNNPNDYWDHVDYIVEAARSRGLALAMLPVWGARYINLVNAPEFPAHFYRCERKKLWGVSRKPLWGQERT